MNRYKIKAYGFILHAMTNVSREQVICRNFQNKTAIQYIYLTTFFYLLFFFNFDI